MQVYSLSLLKPLNVLCFRNLLLSTWAFQTASSVGKLNKKLLCPLQLEILFYCIIVNQS